MLNTDDSSERLITAADPAGVATAFPHQALATAWATARDATAPRSRTRFYVTAPWVTVASVGAEFSNLVGGPLHAKEMGTMLTACGKSAMSWPKVWHVPFVRASGNLCADCASSVQHPLVSLPHAVSRTVRRPLHE